MRSRAWVPLAWYVGIAVVVPLLDGVPFGVHMATTLAIAAAFLLVTRLIARR
jgi:hypothetical protein